MYFPTTQSKYLREQLKEDERRSFGLKKFFLSASEILCKVSTDVQSQWHIYLNNTLKDIVGSIENQFALNISQISSSSFKISVSRILTNMMLFYLFVRLYT